MNPGRTQQARALLSQGRADAARALLLRAVQSDPGDADANSLLRLIYGRSGETAKALYYARRAAEAAPGDPMMMVALGDALCIDRQPGEGIPMLRRALALAPSNAVARISLVRAIFGAGEFDQGERECREAIAAGFDEPELSQFWAFALTSVGRGAEGVRVLEQAEQRRPGHAPRLAQIATLMNYDESAPPQRVTLAHARYAQRLQETLEPLKGPPPRATGPDRRLRVGFVSADLRNNSVAIFLEPLLARLDQAAFELCAYYAHTAADPVNQRLRRRFSLWRDVPAAAPHELAALLRADRIDIAVDLGGMADHDRLAAFFLRTAPVQVTYLGYPNTTGIPAMDARIVDSLTDPPGSEGLATERLVRLDPCFVCYRPPADAPPVMPRPPDAPVVFGSFNVMLKINDRVLEVWARVLAAAAGSSLLIKNPMAMLPVVRERIDRALAAHGVSADRVITRPMSATTNEHLKVFAQTDIVLDPFPYSGTTNTCESLFMGVPVVALAGDRHAARVGVSLLTTAGLPDLIASSEDEYIRIAAALAADRARLSALRSTLRARTLASPVCDETGYAARFGAALRDLWRGACG